MRQGFRPTPATALALLALVAALAGSAYAGGRINGRALKAKSVPGNRIKPRTLAANRLRPAVLRRLTRGVRAPVTGSEIDERSLSQVPSAAYADFAATARTASEAETAVNAVNAVDSATVNGHGAGCLPGALPFAGACWDASANAAATAPVAAAACASRGGTLPEALQLAAFAQQPAVTLAVEGEWSSDIPVYSGLNAYGVIFVTVTGEIDSTASTINKPYRCVIPLVV